MSTAWHASLPQRPLYEGHQETLGDNKATFAVEVGDPIERVRYTAASDQLSLTFQMTLAQYAIFVNFYKVTLAYGTLLFNLYDSSLMLVKDYKINSAPVGVRNAPDGMKVSFKVLRKP